MALKSASGSLISEVTISVRIPAVIIADGESGLLVDSMSSDGLAGAMNTLLADREKARTMGGESFKRAKDNFSWDKISDQTVKLYKEHLKTRD